MTPDARSTADFRCFFILLPAFTRLFSRRQFIICDTPAYTPLSQRYFQTVSDYVHFYY
jgi:hypothetical protein